MNQPKRWIWLLGLPLGLAPFLPSARAETVELVTYYPSTASVQDLHVNSLTVGTAYNGVTPPDGTAVIADRLGIGTSDPQGVFHVVGAPNQADKVVFLSGAGGTLNVGFGTPDPASPLHIQANSPQGDPWIGQLLIEPAVGEQDQDASISLRTTYTATDRIWNLMAGSGGGGSGDNTNFRIFDSTAGLDRLNIDSNGNVGIGTVAPTAKLHVEGGDIQISSGDGTPRGVAYPDGSRQTRAGVGYRDFDYFGTAGSGNWTVPAGVTQIMVEVWGAGGGGAGPLSEGGYAAGGGGGAYGLGVFAVVPGTNYSVTVGAGGAGGVSFESAGSNGGTSSFGTLISAGAGVGASGGRAAIGGAGGTSPAPFNIRGGTGGAWQMTGTWGPAGEGGASPRGGLGAPPTQGGSVPGGAPGGGGGGAGQPTLTGGRGGDGGVMIWW